MSAPATTVTPARRLTRPVRAGRPVAGRSAPLHPAAWWLWALGLALLASRILDPLILLLLLAVTGFVAATCRRPSPWSHAYLVAIRFGVVVLVLRVVLLALTGAGGGTHVLFTLPALTLPHALAGVRFGGPVTAESVVSAAEQGLRLAAMLACLGAANVATTPSRLVKALPAALYEIGLVVTVAVSVAPQTVAALARLRDARRLRGHPVRGPRAVRGIALPALAEALEGSLALAAAMDSRGYGRRLPVSRGRIRLAAAAALAGLVAVGLGLFETAGASTASALGVALIAGGVGGLAAALGLGGARSPRTRYRADRWDLRAAAVGGCGLAAAVVAVLATGGPLADPSPLSLPPVPLAATGCVLLALLPAVLAPGPRRDDRRATVPAPGWGA